VAFVVYSDMPDTLAAMDSVVHPNVPADRAAATVAQVRGIFGGQPEAQRGAWANAQTNIALGFLLLAAEAHGYATSTMLGFDPAAVRALLDLPEHAVIAALVSMGVAAQEGAPHHRHPVERILRIV
jgi:nitroreductase